MGRRRQSTAGDLVDLVALAPWWVGLSLALVSYVVLHRLAAPPPPLLAGAIPHADFMTRAVVSAFAYAGQFALPFLFCMAAVASAVRRKKSSELVQRATGSAPMAAVSAMSWEEFELLVGEAFRLQGFSVSEHGGGGPDGGVDLVLRRGGDTFLVQCKHWRATKVGVSVARELFGVMAADGAAGGYIVTGGEFTAETKAFAHGRNLHLVDGRKLAGLLHQARAQQPASIPRPAKLTDLQQATLAAVPDCPTCQAPMVRRVAKKGGNAGAKFWGCTRYPACRSTR